MKQVTSAIFLLLITSVFGFTCKISTGTSAVNEVPEYYWRDYHGNIPGDAIPGGRNVAGTVTYIGQAYIKSLELLPVTIYPGCTNARGSAYNVERQTDSNIKILCSNDISKFSWIQTTPEITPTITNCNFPIGGSEVHQQLNIGRANYNGEIVIGKVFSYPLSNKGLYIPNETGHETRFLSYEILAYNCQSKNNHSSIGVIPD